MGASAKFMDLWTERRPVPSEMTDTEMMDWLTNRCDHMEYNAPTAQYNGGFTLHSNEGEITFAPTLRGAVCLADAKQKEANQ